ncbi:GH36-type glycosyl hydrolase domain-containing protein [Actimicrobium sp. CCI2.3]|uniref:GH36-type glycosyl hydrolase domain-containing protein n=1 Tax=Actimicrobium sp. CCI2.3 TaxID=3048616 RepID=UPI002AB4303C|nr:glucoamylase family protein [Actimicrobium sp. CCI2.3]MDY7574116.1 glucoamylase family protein [Actimicrobium sp. CCI2.3]MEB0023246.1 glucoamylase family protein [Actimicrobium sp. CCI2.3]
MNALRKLLFDLAPAMATLRPADVASATTDDEPPLRAELYGAAQMEQHGAVLAASHSISEEPGVDQLLARLASNETTIIGACNLLTAAVRENRQITPAAEWLLDNFYLIEEQIRTAKRHLPKPYSKQLPRLATGPSAGWPRVYDLALETIAHGDGRVDPESLRLFIAAYQSVLPLKLGELWAIPIMLRLALIDNLRRVAARLDVSLLNRTLANNWADRMTETADKQPGDLILVVADMARSAQPLVPSFVAELSRRLQGQSPALALPLAWIAQRLSECGETIEHLVQVDTRHQARDQVSMSNSIGSLRFLGAMDWRDFVETLSAVEATLQQDPHQSYRAMDFATRDGYRHIVEQLARGTALSEQDVAARAIALAQQAVILHGADHRNAHVGTYLFGPGLATLERDIGLRRTLPQALRHIVKCWPLSCYLGAMLVLLALTCTAIVLQTGDVPRWTLILIIILAAQSSSQLALGLVNWLATMLAIPQPLPRLDFSAGIPADARALVVVPTMLYSIANIDSLGEALEVRYLANRDPHLRFCLLTDLPDAASERLPGDAALIAYAADTIAALNRQYADQSGSPFILLHRPRRWNSNEQLWMGYERKRGKLGDLNHFLRGGAEGAFSCIVGNTEPLQQVRYVITLDTDTLLPRDAARQFISTLAHPLNRASYDPRLQRVTEGYGILQPRVTSSLPGIHASLYEKLCTGVPGIDPYTRAVSDVYQDVFHEGSFIGKGIYDVDAFEQALDGRLPDNQILSHDLLEGCYARAGLISDAQLHEEYPSRYSDDVKRRHRWIRGDWQLLGWLLPSVPGPTTATGTRSPRQRNPLSALARWKILDNLRRSLEAPALTALLLVGWTLRDGGWFWTLVALLIVLTPSCIAVLITLLRKPAEVVLIQHLNEVGRSAGQHLAHSALQLTFLAHEAAYSLDAIGRTLWRMLISKRRLLEWQPSGSVVDRKGASLRESWRAMWIAPALALAMAVWLLAVQPMSLILAAPLLLLWLMSPTIAWWISRPQQPRTATLTTEQNAYLRQLARKTWRFFETYVGPDDHWLPPDNVQEQPVAVIARRTSPTNIGLSLLANLAAWDFGYLTLGRLLERTGNTLRTMDLLERYRGHFYNWYDTQELKPLAPTYVSSVDSGNLSGHLLTLRPGLLMLVDAPILPPQSIDGLADTLASLVACGDATVLAPLATLRAQIEQAAGTPPVSLHGACAMLAELASEAAAFRTGLPESANTELHWWADALANQCRELHDELIVLAPWLLMPMLQQQACLPALRSALDTIPTLASLARLRGTLQPLLDAQYASLPAEPNEHDEHTLRLLLTALDQGSRCAAERIAELERLALQASEFARADVDFLVDHTTKLLAIGYNVSERRRDESFYDLLASEARLATFVAIAQGQLPQISWFALGRQLTIAGGDPILLSWSGSMFEYLMPLLVMPTFDNTLLDQTYRAAVQRQIDYGAQRDVPWGISESGYNTFDAALNYQYRAFGVPGLGLKRGLGDDLVVAPYATMMALMVAPEAACLNLQRLSDAGFEGRYGMFEAIDYTASRLPRGQSFAVIQSYMVHHQGMGFLSLAYLLRDQPMQRRFAADPLLQATMLLLHERIPKALTGYANTTELSDIRTSASEQSMPMRVFRRTDSRIPEIQLLSNGRYHVMISHAGGSESRWKDLAVTRWRADSTRDNWGTFCYVRDVDDGYFWSSTYQPTLTEPQQYEVIFSEGRAEFRRTDRDIDMHTEVVVSPEDDIEIRRSKITNRSHHRRTIEVTSYAEVVLAPAAADAAHPAFSNLFVQTELLKESGAILCTRRPRSLGEQLPWMLHQIVVHGRAVGTVSFETDRLAFIGRGNTLKAPVALTSPVQPLSNSAGSVLDPVVAVRYQITLDPEESVIIDIVTGVVETRDAALYLIAKYRDRYLADRVFELAWTHSQVVLRQLNASETDAQLYGRLAGSIVSMNPALRADASVLIRNRRGQSGLWSHAISGDLPIVLVQIKELANIELVRQLVQAHAYWRLKGLAVDLVIWNEDHASYHQQLHEQIIGLVSSGVGTQAIDRPGGIFVRQTEQIAPEDRILIKSVARAILSDQRGTLADQINRRNLPELRLPALVPLRATDDVAALPPVVVPALDRILDNGLGGFSPDGREYLITTSASQRTPAPWSNVLANPYFGSVISESGQAYTWSENAHEFRLTPWNNDPVSDSSGEAFYLRDDDSGAFWSPTPLPCRGSGTYETRHGFGYSVFSHQQDGIHSELWVYVALDAAIKYSVLKVTNRSGRPRRLSATGYVEWVLADLRAKSAMHIVTELDPLTGALFARNAYNTEFAERIAFFDVDTAQCSVTGDRTEFIGRNGTLENPAALGRVRLSGKTGAGFDPCSAIQVPMELVDGQQREVIFMLGVAGRRSADVSDLVQRNRGSGPARAAFDAVHAHWDHVLGAVQIDTPDPAVNVLANGWLMYQTIACRLWARSGYYQSGGAYGFRDQLQDAMALIHTEPHLLREQLLRCAAHQFVEGDVQHWWHPPADRGVRTHCSDDYLWLPLATHRYVMASGDHGVLNEVTHFLEGRPVATGEDSYYDLPQRSGETASLYQHCVRAIEHGWRFGSHGLPLIGSCDWNDGMDKVGEHGKGESVWLAFFLLDVLQRFAEVATLVDDLPFATRCLEQAALLRTNVEAHAWDGDWYRRAYFDDGTPLGSASNDECQIDSISQSWAVLSGAADPTRAAHAMEQVNQRLVRRDAALIQLLDPPFSTSDLNPGYIRGYVPGVRENGGQYTHAAIWTAMAFAKLGDGARAWELLDMINPVNHARTAEEVALYKVEPYVVAADVYAVSPHVGRGGWTWYTGSSGWMYRLIIESLLGITLEINRLHLAPLLPAGWDTFTLRYRFRDSLYLITVRRGTVAGLTVDGVVQDGVTVGMVNDGREHRVVLVVE